MILIILLKANIDVDQSYSYYVGATDELQVIMPSRLLSQSWCLEFNLPCSFLLLKGFWSICFSAKWYIHSTIWRKGIHILLSDKNEFFSGSNLNDQTMIVYLMSQIPLTVFKGPLYDEVHQTFSSWVYQVYMLQIQYITIF